MIKEELIQFISSLVTDITGFMHVGCSVDVSDENRDGRTGLLVSVQTNDNANFLIGKNGQSLQSLEQIIRLAVLKKNQGPIPQISLDINGYRKARLLQVVDMARQAISRVRSSQRSEALEPMSSYERRIVHTELAAHLDIATESIGEEPQRRVVIKPFSDSFK